jgi:hypothetical protein
MCKAHFHPFTVIISPFHAMGVKIYILSPKQGAPSHRLPCLNALARKLVDNKLTTAFGIKIQKIVLECISLFKFISPRGEEAIPFQRFVEPAESEIWGRDWRFYCALTRYLPRT